MRAGLQEYMNKGLTECGKEKTRNFKHEIRKKKSCRRARLHE